MPGGAHSSAACEEARRLFDELAGFLHFRGSLAGLVVGAWLAVAAGAAAAPHEGLDALIALADRAVAAEPERGELWLARAELHRLHADAPNACSDLARSADASSPASAVRVELCRARLSLAAGDPGAGLRAAEASVVLAPELADAWYAWGDALAAASRLDDAAAVYTHALTLADAEPEAVMTLVALHDRRGDAEAAAAVLDRAIARAGPVTSLLIAAVERETARGRSDRALEQLDRLAAASPRQERWLAMRGDVLRRAGRPDDAADAYRSAREAIAQRRTRRRSPAVARLDDRLAAALAQIAERSPAPPVFASEKSP